MSGTSTIVIVGAGLAGCEAAFALREYGHEGRIVLVGREPWPPYERPPLSKDYLKEGRPREGLWLRPMASYGEQGIDLLSGVSVVEIDRQGHRVLLDDGSAVEYGQLLLAVGGQPRRLAMSGTNLDGVVQLMDLDEADKLRSRLASRPALVVIGAGYVGMEVAATARLSGCEVTVLECQPSIMSRSLSPAIAGFLESEFERRGVRVLKGVQVAQIDGAGEVQSVTLKDGRRLPAGLVLVSVGNSALDQLARDAGIHVEAGGILIDGEGRTNDPDVFAAGDCAVSRYDGFDAPLRLESVQSAVIQARRAAAVMAHHPDRPAEVPWFWSNQFDIKLQMAGLPQPGDTELVRGDPAGGSFSVIYQNAARMTAIQCVNAPGDYAAARKMIAKGRAYCPQQLCDQATPLKVLLKSAH